MQDHDWIEVGFLFSETLDREPIERFLEQLPNHSGPEYGADEFNITYWENGDREHLYGGASEALKTISSSHEFSVEIAFSGFQLYMESHVVDGLLSSTPNLVFRETAHPFKDREDQGHGDGAAQHRRVFVEALADAAEILDPAWGFGRRGGLAIGEDQSLEELATATRPPLYEYNVFHEETVEAIGRERVLDAPAWYVEELDTGGVFLAVRAPPSSCSTHSEDYVEIADYLGLPAAELSRYH